MTLPAKKSDRIYTYGDYAGWPDSERWELINGVAFNMSPAPNKAHQRVVLNLATALNLFLKGKTCEVFIAPFDVRLPDADETDEFIRNSIQPDIFVVCDQSKLDDKGLRGAPDLVAEVLSPATARKDQVEKKTLYETHGVREYWIIHPTDHLVYVHHLKKGSYGIPLILDQRDTLDSVVLEGFKLPLGEVFSEAKP